jgi:hypothetical protein
MTAPTNEFSSGWALLEKIERYNFESEQLIINIQTRPCSVEFDPPQLTQLIINGISLSVTTPYIYKSIR